MRIGIIKYENNDYYIDLENNNISVTKISNREVTSLKIEEFAELIKEIFDSNLKFKKKVLDYEIFVDEIGNERYFKDGKEDLRLFFVANGKDALLFNDKKPKGKANPHLSKMTLKSKIGKIAIVLATISFFNLYTYPATVKLVEMIHYENVDSESNNIENFELGVADIINGIEKFELNPKEKEYLINEDFFNDILKVCDSKQKYIINERISNMKFSYFNNTELKKDNLMGYYNRLLNKIALRNETQEVFDYAMAHELVHSFQDINQYDYITEACASMFSHEYYDAPISYPNEVKNIKILMELIGPKTILECSFKGDTTSFENKIHEVLNEQDANELLNIFHSVEDDLQENEKKNKSIDRLYNEICKKIYNCDIKYNKYFSNLKEINLDNRFYFNTHSDNINNNLMVGEEIDKQTEINISQDNSFICETIKNIVKEEKTEDNIKTIISTSTSNISFNNFESFEDYYKNNKDNKDENEKIIFYVKNNENNKIRVYCDTDENGNLKTYSGLTDTVLDSIPKRFPEQFNSNIDSMFAENNIEINTNKTNGK